MTKRERDLLALRYVEVEMELAHIAKGGVVDGDPATREWELLGELEDIEYRLCADQPDRLLRLLEDVAKARNSHAESSGGQSLAR
jgi:hypothetical protein